MTNYSQRYATGDSNTAGSFTFDTDGSGGDVPVSKIVFGADAAAYTRVTASVGLPVQLLAGTAAFGKLAANSGVIIGAVEQSGTWTVTGTGGTFPITDSGGSITVDNGGTFAVQATVAAGATNIAKAEDAASADADVGVPAMAIRKATPANTSGTDGDYEMLQMSAGRLWVDASGVTLTVGSHAVTNAGTFAVQVDGAALTSLQLLDDAVSGTGFNISQINGVNVTMGNGASGTGVQRVTIANDSTGILAGVTTVTTVTTCSTVTTLTGGGVAHDAADSGNPHKIGAKATTALSGVTLVANADRTDLYAGSDGVLINRPHCSLEDIVSGNASNTDGTSTQCIAASGAGVKTYLQSVILTNTSASNIYVEIKDGTTVKLTIPVPANGGAVVNLPVPIGGTANTAWNFDPSAATTTVYCSMVGWKSKV